MAELKGENKRLFQRIEGFKNEGKDLQTQVSKLQDDLASQYKLYRDERDARKLLQSDINDLRYQQEDYQMSQKKEDEEDEDPVMLKIALKSVLVEVITVKPVLTPVTFIKQTTLVRCQHRDLQTGILLHN